MEWLHICVVCGIARQPVVWTTADGRRLGTQKLTDDCVVQRISKLSKECIIREFRCL